MSRLRHHLVPVAAALGLVALISTHPGGVGAAPESETFTTVGSHDFVVPEGVTELTVDAYGAAGGSSGISPPVPGGLGGSVRATISVTPGETLQVNVGGAGGDYEGGGAGLGGVNGGGDGGGVGAGGGGGASDVRRGGTALSDRVVVAGGGGAGGTETACETALGGVGGGDAPTAGGSIGGATGGGAGAAGAGGAGGATSGDGAAGAAGTFGVGGAGGLSMSGYAAGGGGGGWYGGGGGGGGWSSAAGGGGSGHVADGSTGLVYGNGVRAGDGTVVISWDPPTTTTTTSTTSTTTTVAPTGPVATFSGGATTVEVRVGGTVDVTSTGWQAGSTVTATLHSDPVVLGTAVAGATGEFQQAFTVPAATPVGQHTLVLSGAAVNGGATFVELGVEVVAAGSAQPASLSFTC